MSWVQALRKIGVGDAVRGGETAVDGLARCRVLDGQCFVSLP